MGWDMVIGWIWIPIIVILITIRLLNKIEAQKKEINRLRDIIIKLENWTPEPDDYENGLEKRRNGDETN